MTGGYRCSQGHATPMPVDGSVPGACPVCGDTTLMPDESDADETTRPSIGPAVVLARKSSDTIAAEKAAGALPGHPVAQTITFAPQEGKPQPHDTPSFSSLVGMPGNDLDATRPDNGSLVPFGSSTSDHTPPTSVPGYEILNEVGRGGMGVVYRARQLSLNRIVALKMILVGSHAGSTERERFRREAEAVATLQNQHIVQIFEIGEANGHPYLALEFVEGGSLAQQLIGHRWSAREAAQLVSLLAYAIHYAHLQGVVHRDLKPGNVLLTSTRKQESAVGVDAGSRHDSSVSRLPIPKITDFGLAKRLGESGAGDGTKTGAVMGTPSYIAPEQASGKTREIGPVTDVYALGAILYELLTGRPPFMGESPLDTVLQVIHDYPVPPKRLEPSIPRDLETICLKCLTKSPAQRYLSAEALAEDLHRFLAGEPIRARPLSAWGRAVKWANRHPALAVLGAATVAATIGLVAVLGVSYAQVKDAVREKEHEAEQARDAREKEMAARRVAETLAEDNERKRREAVERTEELRRQAERTRRAAYALQLAQIAAMCERDPGRARTILEDETRCPPQLRDFTWAYLRRLCDRQERVYTEHGLDDPLRAVAYSPTGAFIATAGDSGEVRLWDPRSGRTWAILVGNTGRVLGVAFSPDGGGVATAGSDGTIRLWSLPVNMIEDARRTVNLLAFLQPVVRSVELRPDVTIAAHGTEVNCVAFSPEGAYLVSGGQDGYLKRWDLRGWRAGNSSIAMVGGPAAAAGTLTHAAASPNARLVWLAREVTGAHRGGVKSIAFAAADNILVSGGADRTACIWADDLSSLARTFPDHADAVLAVAVSANGKILATTDNGPTPTVRLINLDTGRERKLIGHTGAIYALA
ncbi:MAG TPA: protein kinase, partial [Gemmata sp.]|nr:protein kinase [Gemmata sp.]